MKWKTLYDLILHFKIEMVQILGEGWRMGNKGWRMRAGGWRYGSWRVRGGGWEMKGGE